MALPRRSRWTAAVGLLSSFGLAVGCLALAACSSTSGTQTYLPGSGGGPLGAGAGGDDASTGSPSQTPTQPTGGQGDDASSGASDANAPADGGLADGASDARPGEGGASDGATPAITFTLLNATITNVVQGSPVAGYDPLAEGSTFSLATVGASLSIRANTTAATVGSVEFILDANYTHTENTAPYTLCGDNGQGTITPCPQLTAGKHTLTATEFTQANLGGTTEGTAIIDFTITP